MNFETMAYTDAGIDLLMDAVDGQRLTITKAVGGTGIVDPDTLALQVDVSGEKHTLQLLGMEAVGDGDEAARRVKIRIVGAERAYSLRQIGIFGRQDGMDSDTLLLLLQDDRGVDIPAASAGREFELLFTAVIAISRSARISLALTADMHGLKQFIRQEIHDHTAHVRIVDITIPAGSWTEESGQGEYGFTAEISIENVTAEESPTVTLHQDSLDTATACEICPVAETLDSGVLKFWAKQLPAADMAATVQLVSPKSSEELEDLPAERTSLLGTAVCGRAVVGL